jgi:hypothetical protein
MPRLILNGPCISHKSSHRLPQESSLVGIGLGRRITQVDDVYVQKRIAEGAKFHYRLRIGRQFFADCRLI